MNYIVRIILAWCCMSSVAFAETLEIKVDGKRINVPCWVAQKEQLGAVVLVHGGVHTQPSALLDYLASRLAENGWFVAALNDDKSTSLPWMKQLPEVIVTLRQQKIMRIVVLHYGKQLQQTLAYFSKPQAPEVEGLILLSAYNLKHSTDKKLKLDMPIFDIIGQFDDELVKHDLAIRQKTFGNNKEKYLAIEIPGVEKEYKYSRPLLFSFIHGWMMNLPEFQPRSPTFMYTYLHPLFDIHMMQYSV